MSQLEVEEESLYNEPLDSNKRKLTEDVETPEVSEAKKAKLEEDEIAAENETQALVAEDEGEQVVPEVIENLENSANNDDEADESKERPENVSRFIGEVHVNPDPFQLIEQIREEDFSDSESDSSPIFYDSDSSDLVELEYTETVTYWARFDSSENEDWKIEE